MNTYSIVCFPWDTWGPMCKPAQQIMSHLSTKAAVRKVLWVNRDLYASQLITSLGVFRSDTDLSRRCIKSAFGQTEEYTPKILACAPFHFVPFLHKHRALRGVDSFILKRHLRLICRRYGLRNLILFVNRLVDAELLDLFEDVACRCFYWNDDWASFPASSERLTDIQAEQQQRVTARVDAILERSDVVFTVSRILQQRALGFVSRSHWLPNATDFANFARAGCQETPVAREMLSIPRPIIGFVGYITSTTDFDILSHVATARPDWSLVMIGPRLPAANWGDAFFQLKNVYYLGPKEYHALPQYMKAFDVCVIPYVNHESLQAADSNKVFDYLATRKPVVASYPTAGLERFSHVIKISGSKEQFVKDIQESLRDDDPSSQRQREAVARDNSWEQRAEFIWEKILEYLAVTRDVPGLQKRQRSRGSHDPRVVVT